MPPTTPQRQLAFVIDLNKCIGCQGCTIACKRLWTAAPGMDATYWMNVETVPGNGYPRNWASRGGGFRDGKPAAGRRPTAEEYGIPFEFDYSGRLFAGKRDRGRPRATPNWAPNWEEEQGAGSYPNNFFFYLPRLGAHCDNPACVAQCTGRAMHVGFLDDQDASVHKLVRQWKVALPLLEGFGTGPNVFYVPPFLGPAMEAPDGRTTAAAKIPDSYLETLFGPAVHAALRILRAERNKRRQGGASDMIEILIGRDARALLGHLHPSPSR